MRQLLASSLALILAAACTGAPDERLPPEPDAGVDPDPGPEPSSDPLEGLPTGADQWAALCAKGYGDRISLAFCASNAPPTITSLDQLIRFVDLELDADPSNPTIRFTLLGHSTAISGRFITPLNPRAFIFDRPLTNQPNPGQPNPDFAVLAFARGEKQVELVANDPSAGDALRFFLIRFELACGDACGNADLFTGTIESGWTGYSIYDDEAIKNTTLDCLQCHQPSGPGTAKLLRMQELDDPWLHWFYEEIPENLATIQDFLAAHQDEATYGGIPLSRVLPSRPRSLELLIRNNGSGAQPNAFDSSEIRAELEESGTSATWDEIYARAVAGDEIAVPYHSVPQTDPAKVATMIQAYQDTVSGALARDQMPDIADTLLDSALADMSYRPAPGLDGRGILRHMCRHCHNDALDQTISRSRFSVDRLDTLPRSTKDEAIRRLGLGDADRRRMPPARFHSLSAAERQLVTDVLSR